MFDNLSNTGIPGVVLLNCESVLSRICALNCYSSQRQQFGNIYSLFGNYKNDLLESTISHCGHKGISEPTLTPHLGIISLKSVNISFTEGKTYCACQFFNTSEVVTNIQYSSFINNSASEYMNSIYYSKFKVYRCNYQYNEVYSLFRVNPGILIVYECFISNNKASYYYYQQSTNDEVTITNCRLIDNSIPNNGAANIVDENPNLSEFKLFLLKTFDCDAKDSFLHPVHKPYLYVNTCSCYSKTIQSYIWVIIIMTE